MKNIAKYICTVGLLLSVPAFAEWGSDIRSIDAVKHWNEDDRVVHIRGTIAENYGSDGFRISDDTGEIRVHFTNRELMDFHFHPGMHVEVRGRVERAPRHHWDHHWDLEATAVKINSGDVIGHY